MATTMTRLHKVLHWGALRKKQHTFSRSGTTPPLTCLTRPLSGEKHRNRLESRARCSFGSTIKAAAQASESGQVREHRIRQLSRLNACPRSFPSPPRNAVYRIRLAANTVTPEVGCLAGNGHPGVTNYNVKLGACSAYPLVGAGAEP